MSRSFDKLRAVWLFTVPGLGRAKSGLREVQIERVAQQYGRTMAVRQPAQSSKNGTAPPQSCTEGPPVANERLGTIQRIR